MLAGLVLLAATSGVAAASTACGVNMIGVIHSSQERSSKPRIVFSYASGSVVGSAITGAILGVAGMAAYAIVPLDATVLAQYASLTLGLMAVVLGLRELGVVNVRVPQRESQVNYDALGLPGVSRRLFGFGLWLGVGFLTYSPYAGLHLLAAASVLRGSFLESVAVFFAFGLARAATVLVLGLSASSRERTERLIETVAERYDVAHALTAAGGVAVAANATIVLALR
jgi:sulfite exporter TauE/SafE